VGAEAEDAHDAADEQKDEAEGDADVETHKDSSCQLQVAGCQLLVAGRFQLKTCN
jgi:hypothetical protein